MTSLPRWALSFTRWPESADDLAACRYEEDGGVLARDGVIVAVGDHEAVSRQATSGARTVDHRPHLILPGFIDARAFDVVDPAAEGRVGICVQYRLRDQAALQDYLERHAPRLRAEGIARFGGRFNASRRVLRVRA